MPDRKWMPHEFQDEAVPPARPTPSDWIVTLPDGAPALASGDLYSDEEEPGRLLKDGDTVQFDWFESYGTQELTFRHSEDGWKWTLDGDEPPAPPGGHMNVAELGDWETAMPSLAEFVQTYAENGANDGETITVAFYVWSSNSASFVFRGGRFHAVADAPAMVS